MSLLHNMALKRKGQEEMYKMEPNMEGICNGVADPGLESTYRDENCHESTETTDFNGAPIPKDCSIVMNGHYNMTRTTEFNDAQEDDEDEEDRPFINKKKLAEEADNDARLTEKPVQSVKHGGANVVSTKGSSTEDSSSDSANESGEEGEPGRQLLGNGEDCGSIKCVNPKNRLAALVTSPKKSRDSRCHIQHRPLERQSISPAYSLQDSRKKLQWTVVKCVLSGFVTIMIASFVAVMVVLLVADPLECKSEREWWQDVVSYEIFPASFQDIDNDGFGDLRGIKARVEYIKNMSIDVIRLNSIFSALDYPLEYEHVIDFTNVDPHIGRMEDFKNLVTEVHSKGLFLLLDMNPTVTSDQHTWAAHWLLHRKGTYETFYVNFTDDKLEPPMDFREQDIGDNSSVKVERASPHRTFGSHLFLNWSNPTVQLEMLQVIEFWLKEGIDGFYMKHLDNMKVKDSRDIEPIIKTWRDVLEKYSVNTTRKILASSLKTLEALQERCGVSSSMLSMFDVIDAGLDFAPDRTLEVSDEIWRVRNWVASHPSPPWIWWHFGSVETSRLASRVGAEYTMNTIFVLTLLPGSVSFFYGDEFQLEDSYDINTKRVFRGGQLTIMLWTGAKNANFTSDDAKPWLPIHPNVENVNMDRRIKVLSVLRRLLYLKKSSLQQVTPNQPSFGSLIGKSVGTVDPHQPNYRWSHEAQSNTLMLEVSFGGKRKALLVANFGITDVKMSDVKGVQKYRWYDLEYSNLKLVFSTDSYPVFHITEGILKPGHSLLCLYDS